MDQDMDLTIGSLNFRVGSLGLIRLSDPAKPDPSASEAKTIAMSESSVGSSSEANSPVSFATTEIAEVDKNIENFDLGDQLEDLMICHDDTSDKSTDTWKTGLELHEDDDSIFSSFNSKFDNRYQVLAIVGDNSKEFDENNNPVLNPANINRGANHLAEGETIDSWWRGVDDVNDRLVGNPKRRCDENSSKFSLSYETKVCQSSRKKAKLQKVMLASLVTVQQGRR
jgi:hypothetical protein